MYRLWNENNVKSSKVVSLRQNKSHSPLNLEKLKIITYNTNGLRAAVGKGLPEWLAQEQPDVLCIQETKLQPDQFPSETFEDVSIVSVYHPSGTSGDERQDFKMLWLEDFQKYVVELQKSRPNLILCGDYNICHEPIDIHDPIRNAKNSGFLPEEREWMTRFLSAGFTDTFRFLNPDKQEYTWWSYRFNSRSKNKGWRIDYCMVSDNMKPKVKAAYILNDAVHSDHCPAVLEIE